MTRTRIAAGCAAVVYTVVFGLPLSQATPDPKAKAATYIGAIAGTPDARVSLSVEHHRGEPSEVRFRAKRVEMRCDSGRIGRFGFGPKTMSLEDGRFDDIDYYSPLDFGVEDYIRISGKLLPNGQARGYIFRFINNPSSSHRNRECTTAGGLARWEAERR